MMLYLRAAIICIVVFAVLYTTGVILALIWPFLVGAGLFFAVVCVLKVNQEVDKL